jgi:2-amino-4-hydroxy-6-hydroxymethyldihydropteridine diphosphokinase
MNEVFLSLGGNLGNREQNLKTSMQLINEKVGQIIIQSSFYETAAWGLTDQPSFLNCVIKIKSQFAPNELLTKLLFIEKRLGRERKIKWGSRVIDIDILSYNNEIINDDDLKIVFLIFYSSIIYHLAKLMKQKEMKAPRYITFSGTGSKIISITD